MGVQQSELSLLGGGINAQIGRNIGANDKSNTVGSMDLGKQTHREIKLKGSQNTDYVGLTHLSM